MADLEKIEQLIELIPYGKENAVTRYQLYTWLGTTDREVRRLISLARLDTVILNCQSGKGGYYRPTKKETAEVEAFLKQESARAKSIFRSLKSTRRYLRTCEFKTGKE